MRRIARVFLIGIIFGSTGPAASSTGFADEGGLGGDITIEAAWISGRPSLLEVSDDNETISGLDAHPGYDTAIEPYLAGSFYYTIPDSGTTLFLSTAEVEAGISAGISQLIATAGQINAAVTFGEREVWKDPYSVGSKRRKTTENTFGLTLSYEDKCVCFNHRPGRGGGR